MRTMTARELKNRTGEALRAARAGGTVLITVHGKPAAIVSPAHNERTASSRTRSFDAVWKEIESALSKGKSAFRTWREAEDFSRSRR